MGEVCGPGEVKYVIGWREWVSLPGLGIPGVKAKVDTGARTSALHTHDYEEFGRDGLRWVRFHLHPLRNRDDVELECEAPVTGFREVKDSGGHAERRPFILATACLGPLSWDFEMSLTNRESMRFRMLLGRTALAGRFLVDTRASYLMGRGPARKYPPVKI